MVRAHSMRGTHVTGGNGWGLVEKEKGISRETYVWIRVERDSFFGATAISAHPLRHTQTHPRRVHQGGISISKSTPATTTLPLSSLPSSFFKNSTHTHMICRL